MTNQEKAKKAADILTEAAKQAQELLAHAPMIALTVKNSVQRMVAQIGRASGGRIEIGERSRESKPLTHIFGKPIHAAPKEAKTPDLTKVLNDLEYLGAQVLNDIKAGALPTDVLGKHESPAILAAAAMVGLDVSATDNANAKLIADIYNKIEEDNERAEQDAAATAAAGNAEAEQTPVVPEPEAQPEQPTTVPSADKVAKYKELDAEADKAIEAYYTAKAAKENLPANATPFQKGEATRKLNEAEKAMNAACKELDDYAATMTEEELAQATSDEDAE